MKIFTYHSKKNVLWLRNNLNHQCYKSNLKQTFHGCLIRRILIKLLHRFVCRHSWEISFREIFATHHRQGISLSADLKVWIDFEKLAKWIYFVRVCQKNPRTSFSEFFYPSRSRGSPKRACRALGVPVGLVYHHRTQCGAYHQPLWGCISSRGTRVSFLRLDDIQHFVLMIYRSCETG